MLLDVHGDRKDYCGRGTQDGHLDFRAAPELWAVSVLLLKLLYVHLDFRGAPEL